MTSLQMTRSTALSRFRSHLEPLCLAMTASLCIGGYTFSSLVSRHLVLAVIVGSLAFVGVFHVVFLGHKRRVKRDDCCKIAFLNLAFVVPMCVIVHATMRNTAGLTVGLVIAVGFFFVSTMFVFVGVLVGIQLMKPRWKCMEREAAFWQDAEGTRSESPRWATISDGGLGKRRRRF